MSKTATAPLRRGGETVSAGPHGGDEDWQLSKDSADAATAPVSRQGGRKKRNRNRNRGLPDTGIE